MTQFVGRRLIDTVPTIFVVTILVFSIVRLIPGDPAVIMAGDFATPERVAQLRHEWGLDRPLPVQYAVFIERLLAGNLGESITSQAPVTREILPRFEVTLKLALSGTLVAIVLGGFAGLVGGVRPYTFFDYLSMTIALLGISVPIFWTGLMFILLFAVKLGWLPSGGVGTAAHYVLPAVSIGLFTAGVFARQLRSSLLEVTTQDYIRTAFAKGLGERVVIFRHALRNAMVPVVTIIGVQFGRLLGGAILTETVFSLPGMGRYLVLAISARDYPVIQGIVLVFALAFVLVNLIVDLSYGMVDPRIRFD